MREGEDHGGICGDIISSQNKVCNGLSQGVGQKVHAGGTKVPAGGTVAVLTGYGHQTCWIWPPNSIATVPHFACYFHTLTILPTLNTFAYTSYLLDNLSVSLLV